jgi:hypothetical protein
MDQEPSDKKPEGGLAIVVGAPTSEDKPGVDLPKDFAGDKLDGVKAGDTITITLKAKVVESDEEGVSLDFESVESCESEGGSEDSGEGDTSDDMDDRFNSFSKDKGKKSSAEPDDFPA